MPVPSSALTPGATTIPGSQTQGALQAMKFLNNVDLTTNQLLNAKLQNLASDLSPAGGNASQVWYNTATNQFRGSNGTTVDTLTNLLESISGTGAIQVGGITGKSQAISILAASGSQAGTMSSSDYTKLAAAASANTAGAIVQRDGSGNFAAGTITATLTGTASNATQLNGQAASYYLSRTNQTGTQTASTISDLATVVQAYRLDQFAAPTSPVSYNTQRIISLADPTSPQDAATKNYVDSVATGLDFKASVRAATTAALAGVTYTATAGASGRGQFTTAPNTVDGVTLAVGNRILVKNQATGAQNGIYVVTTVGTGANGVWDRASDFDQDSEVSSGAFMFVEEGTSNTTTSWVLSTANPITIGGSSGTALTFSQFGAGSVYTAGNGLSIAGNQFSVKVDTTTTNPNSLSVGANGVTIATTYVGQASITTVGTVTAGTWQATAVGVAYGGTGATSAAAARTNLGATTKYATTLATSATSYTVNHALNTTDVDVTVQDTGTKEVVYPNVVVTDANNVTVSFATAPSAGAYRVTVVA